MPWTAKDAYGHNKKANTPSMQAQWATVANNILEQTGDEARAIKEANAAINNRPGKPSSKSTPKGMAPAQPLPMQGRPTMGGPPESSEGE